MTAMSALPEWKVRICLGGKKILTTSTFLLFSGHRRTEQVGPFGKVLALPVCSQTGTFRSGRLENQQIQAEGIFCGGWNPGTRDFVT
jgi:hypothetical protein